MPCFKGLAVSIHSNTVPLPEYSIQKQSKHSRITSYIPVPPPTAPANGSSDRPEQPSFAISITLLTPGMRIPYAKSRSAEADGGPQPQYVGLLPQTTGERGKYESVVRPYTPLTSSQNETVAAYIYFDGRAKEEVATLLRRGEETWVNSRWVSVPESEGGGLAEREFLFREVGLERWLNGLDLDGKDVDAKIQRRKERLERRRRRKKEQELGNSASRDIDMDQAGSAGPNGRPDARNGLTESEKRDDDDEMLFSSDSDSEPPVPEMAGQIKVALFRVIASGEIKRGEYSPQFDAHDDDDEADPARRKDGGAVNGTGADPAEVDHTTSFAKPKTLDPETISTQTVTGIDVPDKPYAVFTFLYRSERQLQKMGILANPKSDEKTTSTPLKRQSLQTDFSKVPPLRQGGAVNFSTFRDANSKSPPSGQAKTGKGRGLIDDDSDEDIEDNDLINTVEDDKNEDVVRLSPAADADLQGELAEGVRKIKLKRAHSAEALDESGPRKAAASNSSTAAAAAAGLTPQTPSDASVGRVDGASTPPNRSTPGSGAKSGHPNNGSSTATMDTPQTPADGIIGSPLKKSRPSLAGLEDEAMHKRLGLGLGLLGSVGAGTAAGAGTDTTGGGGGGGEALFASPGPGSDLAASTTVGVDDKQGGSGSSNSVEDTPLAPAEPIQDNQAPS